jgi:kynurenine formamidase
MKRQTSASSQSLLSQFSAMIVDGAIDVIDLTHTLSPDFPVIVLPPELGQCQAFRMEEVSCFDERGPAWYWNNISMSEHSGTHFDAPAHWITGRNLANATVDALPAHTLIAQALVLDFSKACVADPDFLLKRTHLEEWEATNGPIPARSWVLFRTDWCKKVGHPDYVGLRADGAHSPGPAADAIEFLVHERDILGFGAETVGTDWGQAAHLCPPYPAHHILHGAGKYGLQCLNNLYQLPTRGAVVIAAPLKIQRGSGSPSRVLAFVPNTDGRAR